VTDNPLPRLADLESSIFTLELESFVAVEAVTGIDAIYFEDAVTDGVMVVFSLPMANSRYYNSAQVGLRISPNLEIFPPKFPGTEKLCSYTNQPVEFGSFHLTFSKSI